MRKKKRIAFTREAKPRVESVVGKNRLNERRVIRARIGEAILNSQPENLSGRRDFRLGNQNQ